MTFVVPGDLDTLQSITAMESNGKSTFVTTNSIKHIISHAIIINVAGTLVCAMLCASVWVQKR